MHIYLSPGIELEQEHPRSHLHLEPKISSCPMLVSHWVRPAGSPCEWGLVCLSEPHPQFRFTDSPLDVIHLSVPPAVDECRDETLDDVFTIHSFAGQKDP